MTTMENNQPEILEDGVVEVESLDAVKVEERQHWPQWRQQDAVLYLEVFYGLQKREVYQ